MTVVELMDQIIPGADRDMVTPVVKRISKQYAAIHLQTKVTKIEAGPDELTAHFEGGSAPATQAFDKVLVAVGRKPNDRPIGAENAGVWVDERGHIPVDKQMRTNVGHIFAIGDVVGQPMPAHKATPGAEPEDGVMAHLINADPSRGLVASIIHLKPGTAIAAHSHKGFAEAHYVLEGDLLSDGEEFGPGGYTTHGPGVVHDPHSLKNGCRVLTVQTGHPGPEQSDHRLAGGAGQSSS